MYRLTDIMIQNLEKDLRKFHELFQGGRCQSWQLEELIAKAVRSDFSKSEKVIWQGNNHSIGYDIIINDTYKIQIKSGKIEKDFLILSGHRLGSFRGDLTAISQFINNNSYLLISVPYSEKKDSLGKKHSYQLFYIEEKFLKTDNGKWKEKESKNNKRKAEKPPLFCINDYGVELSLRPSMSWQIWWKIPLSLISNENKTRVITIQ